jgi:hypothetical protein
MTERWRRTNLNPSEPPTPQFIKAVQEALAIARESPDEKIRYCVDYVPIVMLMIPTEEQANAGGSPGSSYMGPRVDKWPGYPVYDHGMIFIYEQGIQMQARDNDISLRDSALRTILHEYDHALRRDHITNGISRAKRAAMSYIPNPTMARPCCGNRY